MGTIIRKTCAIAQCVLQKRWIGFLLNPSIYEHFPAPSILDGHRIQLSKLASFRQDLIAPLWVSRQKPSFEPIEHKLPTLNRCAPGNSIVRHEFLHWKMRAIYFSNWSNNSCAGASGVN